MNQSTHQSVLLEESIRELCIDPSGIYIDATFGCGGHSRAILKQLDEQGCLIALDHDPHAASYAEQCNGLGRGRFHFVQRSFTAIKGVAEQYKVAGSVRGILFDLGVSSPQLDNAERGFSFLRDGPLDMRMNPNQGMSAATWLQSAREEEMADIFKTYGEERFSKRIARHIVEARAKQAITRTGELADIVKQAHPRWERHKHPATRVFQAIRIFINQELDALEQALHSSLDILAMGGRLVVISFHSLEDRIVKYFMQGRLGSYRAAIHFVRRLRPTEEEKSMNPRSRSALLRVAERVS